MTSNTEFRHLEDAIRADPDDITGYQVYADWLQARGDPRGTFAQLQIAQHQQPRPELRAQISQFLANHRVQLIGDLPKGAVHISWRFGFARRMVVRVPKLPSRVASLKKLLTHPGARFLRSLDIYDRTSAARMTDWLRNMPCRHTLGELAIGHRTRPAFESVQDLEQIFTRFPQLNSLTLHADTLPPQTIEYLQNHDLAGLGLDVRTHTAAAVRTVLSAPWPHLEKLAIWQPQEMTIQDLAPIFNTDALPKLQNLSLMGSMTNGASTLLRSPRAQTLQSFDFSTQNLVSPQIGLIARLARQLPQLKLLPSAEESSYRPRLYNTAVILRRAGQPERARKLLRRTLSQGRDEHLEERLELARAERARGHVQEALLTLGENTQHVDARIHVERAYALLGLDRIELAQTIINMAAQCPNSGLEVLQARVHFAQQTGQPTQTHLRRLRRAVLDDPSMPRSEKMYLVAETDAALGDEIAAQTALHEAIELDPSWRGRAAHSPTLAQLLRDRI